MKSKIKTIVQSGQNQWKDRTLTKWFVQFEDDSKPPNVGEEIEYEIVDNGFGNEIKLPRKGGPGFRKENPATQRSIERQKAAQIAFETMKVENQDAAPVLNLAELIYKWISQKEPTGTKDDLPWK